jgi:tetratricopeptide (TPR) repeat protein
MKYIFLFVFAFVCLGVQAQDKNAAFAEFAKKYQKQQSSKSKAEVLKKDISKHIPAVALLDKNGVLKMCAGLQEISKTELTAMQLHTLNDLLKELKNDSAAVNEAMMLYAAEVKPAVPVYLLTSIIDKSVNPWYINNLGVILKSNEEYEKAIQCFLYADKNLEKPSPIVKTNIGWAAAYYGDFDAAKKYFNEALKISSQHDGALEGLCMIAYAEGDFKSLMENLFKRIKISNGGGGGTVNQFVAPGLVDDILDAYENNNELKKSDPFENHLFDNDAPEDNVYNPGGAAEIIPQLPVITAYFSYDAFAMNENTDAIKEQKKKIAKDRENDIATLTSELNRLPPWKKAPYQNEQGEWIYPYNYEAEYKMFERITIEFNKRDVWIAQKMTPEEIAFNKTLLVGPQLTKMLNACAGKQNCPCEWAKSNIGVVNNDLSGYFGFWSRLYKQWLQNVNWYIASTSAYIKKVHEPKLNAYLNHKRELIVKDYIQSKYATWLDDCLKVAMEVDMFQITKECVNNPPKTSIAVTDDVMTPPLKKLKRWPEPCVVPTGDFDYDDAPAGIVMTCDELKLRFGMKKKIGSGASASAALHLDMKFGENEKQDELKIYLQAGVKAGVSKAVSVDGKNVGEVGAGGALKGTAFIQFKGGKTNYGVEATSEVTGSLGAKSGEEGMSKNEKDIAGKIDKYLPGAEAKASGTVLWTAETGPKAKLNGAKVTTSNIPTE